MRKNYFTTAVLLLTTLLFVTSCQKEAKELDIENENASVRSGNSGGCRLTMYHYYDAIHDYTQLDQYTYKNGLVDEWAVSWGALVKMEYNSNGTMNVAKMYIGDELAYTVQFIYKSGKLTKEIWYMGNTDIVDDEVFNTYNQKGQMIKNESINYDYYTVYTYDAAGAITSFLNYYQGIPFVKGEYSSIQRYKNPHRSAQGLAYQFAYSNGGLFTSPWWFSSERWIYFDENGNPDVYYDLDPAQTLWTPALQNYPQQTVYTDLLTDGIITNTFDYENCSPGESSRASSTLAGTVNRSSKAESLKAVLYGSKKDLAKRINAFRIKLRNSQ